MLDEPASLPTSVSVSEPRPIPESLLWSEIPRSSKDWLSAAALRCTVRAAVCKVFNPFSMHWCWGQMMRI